MEFNAESMEVLKLVDKFNAILDAQGIQLNIHFALNEQLDKSGSNRENHALIMQRML